MRSCPSDTAHPTAATAAAAVAFAAEEEDTTDGSHGLLAITPPPTSPAAADIRGAAGTAFCASAGLLSVSTGDAGAFMSRDSRGCLDPAGEGAGELWWGLPPDTSAFSDAQLAGWCIDVPEELTAAGLDAWRSSPRGRGGGGACGGVPGGVPSGAAAPLLTAMLSSAARAWRCGTAERRGRAALAGEEAAEKAGDSSTGWLTGWNSDDNRILSHPTVACTQTQAQTHC